MGRSSRLALKGHYEALSADFNPSTARSVKYIIWGGNRGAGLSRTQPRHESGDRHAAQRSLH